MIPIAVWSPSIMEIVKNETPIAQLAHDEIVDRLRKAVDQAADDASSAYPDDPTMCYTEAWQRLIGRLAHLVDDMEADGSPASGRAAHTASLKIRGRVSLTDDQ